MKTSVMWTTHRFEGSLKDAMGEWVHHGPSAKVLPYVSPEYGAVVLSEWPDGCVSIQRLVKEGISSITLSKECLDKIQALRGQLPPDEVALAVAPEKPAPPPQRKKK